MASPATTNIRLTICRHLIRLNSRYFRRLMQVTFQNSSQTILRVDSGSYGPEIEEFHYYYQQWPIGLATAETPYPSPELNLPVSQLNTSYNGIPFGSANASGRPTILNSEGTPTVPYAQPGGPKIVGIDLTNDTIYATYTFPASVYYPDSYMNDIRFDLRPSTTASGKGIAYIVDSSDEGRPGFIMLDLGTGESWRRLTQDASTLRVDRDVPSYQGRPFYPRTKGAGVGTLREGLDGLQISPDGETVYYSPLTSDYLYSIPTANLRARDADTPRAELDAKANVTLLGQRGGNANGFEGDSNGLRTRGWVRDPRIIWPDSASVGEDGWFYLNVNQLPFQGSWNDGVEGRVFPGPVLRWRVGGAGGTGGGWGDGVVEMIRAI
ncbi:hypothetical protein CC80DRAFT_520381 [Byssothecium circinans]|uniref:Major royal jelly protein n=1 Tax=Byssothecium circinans TaxID=147558 RepID=A0A6A5TBN9_9PLEO|nr:hypothetical protein CC80DRAFT_520381 [Byssothecium circinans]